MVLEVKKIISSTMYYKTALLTLFLFLGANNVNAAVPSNWSTNFDSFANGTAWCTGIYTCSAGATIPVISTDYDTQFKSLSNTSILDSRTLLINPGTNLLTNPGTGNNLYFLFAFKPNSLANGRFNFSLLKSSAVNSTFFTLTLAHPTLNTQLTNSSSTNLQTASVMNNLLVDQWNAVYVHYNKATKLVRYRLNNGLWSAQINAFEPASPTISNLLFQWVSSGSNQHLIDTIITTDVDPTPITISRIESATPPPKFATTTTTILPFNIIYTSAAQAVTQVCLYLTGVTFPQNFVPKCVNNVSSGQGLTFATTTTVTNNGVYVWHATLFNSAGNIIDTIVQRTITVGVNSNPNQAWDDFIDNSATTTPVDATTFCQGLSFTIGAVCEFTLRLITPLQAPINNSYLQIQNLILSKAPFIFIVQINQTFRNSQLIQTQQFQGISLKLTANNTVTVLTQSQLNSWLSPNVLTLIRNIMIAVIWLMVLMFFWSQRNVFKV